MEVMALMLVLGPDSTGRGKPKFLKGTAFRPYVPALNESGFSR
jgi:hypothetical protein